MEMGLINLDEFDRIPVRRHPALKNVMQLTDLHVRKAYRRDTLRLPRIASFIGTSNSRELLSDPSGSRRFICVLVEHPINTYTLWKPVQSVGIIIPKKHYSNTTRSASTC